MWWIYRESEEPCLDRQSDNYVFVRSFFCAIFARFSVDQFLNIFSHFIVSSYTLLRCYVHFFVLRLLVRVIWIQWAVVISEEQIQNNRFFSPTFSRNSQLEHINFNGKFLPIYSVATTPKNNISSICRSWNYQHFITKTFFKTKITQICVGLINLNRTRTY